MITTGAAPLRNPGRPATLESSCIKVLGANLKVAEGGCARVEEKAGLIPQFLSSC